MIQIIKKNPLFRGIYSQIGASLLRRRALGRLIGVDLPRSKRDREPTTR
jgi:hypothetical protein